MKQRLLMCGLLLLCLLLVACGKDKTKAPSDLQTETANQQLEESPAAEVLTLLMPWEADGAKQPEEYTLEEYEALTADQRKAFLKYLGAAAYAEWLERAEEEAAKVVEIPWKNPGAKQPKDYTWADYQALTQGQQKAFMEALGPYGLEAWLNQVRGVSSSHSGNNAQNGNTSQGTITIPGENGPTDVGDFYPWEKVGGKDAVDYTWEEYDALSSAQKKAFRDYLGKSFERWLERILEAEYPWLADGAKQPKDYTWAEYMALRDNQKKAFQEVLGASGYAEWQKNALNQDLNNPWDAPGAKQPKDYTWAEYVALQEAQQGAFQEHLGEKAMMAWLRTITDLPWEKSNAKKPEKYTLQEYENLKAPQQLAFRIHMGFAEFEAWLIEAQNPVEANPWDAPGAKQPKDYTWEEFCALTAAQQMAFQNHMGAKGYENWLNKVQGEPVANPWDASGAKQPVDYTWEEYNALTAAQQMAFQNHLGATGFESWLNKVQEKPEEKPAKNPWDAPGAKQPEAYTWKEFNALTADQQMAFQNHLGPTGFEAWLKKAQESPAVTPTANPWDAPGAKQPEAYTWKEFNALTADQQMAFQNHLGPTGFEAWLNEALETPTVAPSGNPWDAPDAKQPEDYTWAEFEALTAAQQMAFQNYLGKSGFEAWLSKVLEDPTEEPADEFTEVPTEVPTEEPADESLDAPIEEIIDEPAEASMDEPTVEPVEESMA